MRNEIMRCPDDGMKCVYALCGVWTVDDTFEYTNRHNFDRRRVNLQTIESY